MQATVLSVERTTEGDKAVLRCALSQPDGSLVPVEMRGDELRGLLREGDEVELPVGVLPPGNWHPTELVNLTTGATVTAWEKPLAQRAGKFVASGLVSGVLSALATLIVTSLAPASQSALPPRGAPVDDSGTSPPEAWAWLFVAISVIVLLATVILLLVRPPGKRPKPIALAMAIGGMLGTLVVAVSIA